MTVWKSIFAIFLVAAAKIHGDEPNPHNLSVTVVSCAADAATAQEVLIFGNANPSQREYKPIEAKAEPVAGSPGTYEASFQLTSGIYWVNARGPKCAGPAMATVAIFPSRNRHVYLITTEFCCALSDDTHGAIGVKVPDGLSVDMVSATRDVVSIPGKLDGGATYFDALRAGRYILEIRATYSTGCIPVEVPFIRTGFQKFLQLTTVDIAPLLREAALRRDHWKC